MNMTPLDALKEYRLHAPPEHHEQAAIFRSMTVPDRMELLFYMLHHANLVIQVLHAHINPEAARTTPFEKTTTQ